jgi:hypothetical protein|uniref:Papain-like cysteine peptidase n=1 Tax=viral metagenome TaxID=1070528 RepID=A0A6C0HXM7_9ZZZZ
MISIGDHCTVPLLLKELNLRTKSYPFDWTTHEEQLHDTNIMHNLSFIQRLSHDNLDSIVEDYLGPDITKGYHDVIRFPHEVGTKEEIAAKYARRFERLREAMQTKQVYVMLTRHYFIPPPLMEKIRNTLLHHGSILVFLSGTDHPYLNYPDVIFKHIPYDVSQFYEYDYTHFRPMVKDYLSRLDNLLHDRIV